MTDASVHSAGFVLTPNIGVDRYVNPAFSKPSLLGPIPNPVEFSSGPDIGGDGFLIKKSGWDMCIVPATHKAFLPTIQTILDEQYALGNASRKTFLIRASRRTAAVGEPHQNHIPDWHDHKGEGKVAIYSAADTLGTEFKLNAHSVVVPRADSPAMFYQNLQTHSGSSAPSNSIVRFDQDALHRTPRPSDEAEARRTFFVLISYENGLPWSKGLKGSPSLENPVEQHVFPNRADRSEILKSWQNNATNYFSKPSKDPSNIVVLLDSMLATHLIGEIEMKERSENPLVRSILDEKLGQVLLAAKNPIDNVHARAIHIKTADPIRTMHFLHQTPGVSFASYAPA